ncbi:MAG TPA: ankyrin repeat domain-containing protein [Nocardioides sp.]|uniref:ankyrin repeat domain-containing protein n=1 Tax=Nocardioides sp. TaxID=35761 RepID=UPI002E372C9D|nr:ankyrin repeat domain-containing protein [Nocardioides sp.]HEX5088988.1 ankyrin repeat domain-containing protein [Nocardioides sp.]
MREYSTREPDLAGPQADPADEFLRLACLTYGGDSPARWANAQALLVGRPDLGSDSVHVAAARADGTTLRRLLAADRAKAATEGGPFGWPPLLYLAYARHDPEVTAEAVRDAVCALLEAGADPDAGYLWHGNHPPFTALTGAFGHGESGVTAQPPHPQWEALARALLEGGADPNDAQTLYNRTFDPDDCHLELLFEFGLDDRDELAFQLAWAVAHGMDERVRLLVAHGVDPDTEVGGRYGIARRSAYAAAATSGHPSTAELLERLGASPVLSPEEAVLAAVFTGAAVDPEAVAAAVAARPGLVAWAAELGDRDAVHRAVGLGWDVNRKARIDVPSDQEWETGLHAAAGNGDTGLVRLLLELGADPAVTDTRFRATPAGWAEHFGHDDVAALLGDRSR